MVTTGKVTWKQYQCQDCGFVSMQQTNHWGEIYPKCRKCGWSKPMQFGQVHICLEKVPEGVDLPEPWKMVKLGDVVEIRSGTVKEPRRY